MVLEIISINAYKNKPSDGLANYLGTCVNVLYIFIEFSNRSTEF
jgi:hypothetical protein